MIYLTPPSFSWLSARSAWHRYSQQAVRGGALALLLLLGACEKPDLELGEAGVAAARQTDSAGKSKDNPFTVEVMRRALKNLQPGKDGDSNFSAQSQIIQPTHIYVRFKPADTDQLADLQALGLQLSFEPLDETAAANTVVNYYSDEIPWVYSAVPYQVSLPAYIQREKLEDLHLFHEDAGDQQDEDPWEPDPEPPTPACTPEYDPTCNCYRPCPEMIAGPTTQAKRNNTQAATEQLKQAGISPLALYNEAMRITGHKEEIIEKPAPGEITIQSTRYYPSGTIRVRETALDAFNTTTILGTIPVQGVRVQSQRWFKIDEARTNSNGYFYINKGYVKNARIIVHFKNDLATTRGTTPYFKPWESLLPIRHVLGLYEKGQMQGLNALLDYQADGRSAGARAWAAATLFNAVADARAFALARGLPPPVQGINVWILPKSGLSAPMLRQIATTSRVSKFIDFMLVGSGLPEIAALKQVIQRQLPDVTYSYAYSSDSDYLTKTTDVLNAGFYHELAHTQHYSQAGNAFWVAYIDYILDNGTKDNPYGVKSEVV